MKKVVIPGMALLCCILFLYFLLGQEVKMEGSQLNQEPPTIQKTGAGYGICGIEESSSGTANMPDSASGGGIYYVNAADGDDGMPALPMHRRTLQHAADSARPRYHSVHPGQYGRVVIKTVDCRES